MHARRPRTLTAAIAAVLAAAVVPALAAGPAAARPAGKTGGTTSAAESRHLTSLPQTAIAGLARAHATDRPVVITAEDTPVSQITANPNGTLTDDITSLPARVQQHGAWVPLSGRLVRGPGRTWRPAAPWYGTVALSDGGTGPVATLTGPAGPAMTLSLPGTRLPAPVIRGATATYRAIRPGITLQVAASPYSGITIHLIIATPEAAATARAWLQSLAWHYAASGGLKLASARDGTVQQATTAAGTVFDLVPAQLASPVKLTRAGYRKAAAAGRARVLGGAVLEPAAGPQLSTGAVYPATLTTAVAPDAPAPASGAGARRGGVVAPAVVSNPVTPPLTGEVEAQDVGLPTGSSCSGVTNFWNGTGTDPLDDGLGFGIGYNAWTTSGETCYPVGIYQSYLLFNTTSLGGYYVDSAALYVNEDYVGTDECGTTDKNIYLSSMGPNAGIGKSSDGSNVGSPFTNTSPDSPVPPASGTTQTCSNQGASFDVTAEMTSAATNGNAAWTFGLHGGNATDGSGFLRLGNPSVLQATIDAYPPAPTPEQTDPPSMTDPWTSAVTSYYGNACSGEPPWISAAPTVELGAKFYSGDTGDNIIPNFSVADGGGSGPWVYTSSAAELNAGTTGYYTVPNAPVDGAEYLWYALTSVDLSTSKLPTISGPGSDICGFLVDKDPPVMQGVTSSTFPAYGTTPGTTQTFPGASGTFTFSAADALPYGCSSAKPAADAETTGGAGPATLGSISMGTEHCFASGVYAFEYALNSTPMPTGEGLASGGGDNCVSDQSGVVHASNPTGNPNSSTSANPAAVTTGTSCTIQINQFGMNTLYVAAIDRAGNSDANQPTAYHFYVPWNQNYATVAGDVNGDGIPDLLATMSSGPDAGDLVLYPGDSDPTTPIQASTSLIDGAPPSIASPATDSPYYSTLGGTWSDLQITHRGSWLSSNDKAPDDIVVLDNHTNPATGNPAGDLELYQNSETASGQFENTGSASAINYPTCIASGQPGADPDNTGNCTGYPAGWQDFSQILIPGDAWTGAPLGDTSVAEDTQRPSLLAIDNSGDLWLFQGNGGQLQNPVLLGTGWSGVTLIAPGDTYINSSNQLTLWARINSSGDIESFPIGLSPDNVPTLDPGTTGKLETPGSGTTLVVGNNAISLPASSYPLIASSGPLSNTTCSTTVLLACPGLYAVNTSGELYYYGGQPATTPALALTGSSVDLGPIGTNVKQIS
jgi:hypothetical protein